METRKRVVINDSWQSMNVRVKLAVSRLLSGRYALLCADKHAGCRWRVNWPTLWLLIPLDV